MVPKVRVFPELGQINNCMFSEKKHAFWNHAIMQVGFLYRINTDISAESIETLSNYVYLSMFPLSFY